MTEHDCPECGFEGVRRANSLALHWARCLWRDSRRYCPHCNARWKSHSHSTVRRAAVAVILLAAGAAVNSMSFAHRRVSLAPAGAPVSANAPTSRGSDAELGSAADAWMAGDESAEDGSGAMARRMGKPSGLRVEIVKNKDSWLTKQARLFALVFGFGGAPSGAKMNQLLQEDKHQLWNEYGQYFSSKQQAEQAYNQAKAAQAKAKPQPQAPPED